MKTDKDKKMLDSLLKEQKEFRETHVPIYRGCPRGPGDCNCTGECQEIVDWREKGPEDKPIEILTA